MLTHLVSGDLAPGSGDPAELCGVISRAGRGQPLLSGLGQASKAGSRSRARLFLGQDLASVLRLERKLHLWSPVVPAAHRGPDQQPLTRQ